MKSKVVLLLMSMLLSSCTVYHYESNMYGDGYEFKLRGHCPSGGLFLDPKIYAKLPVKCK